MLVHRSDCMTMGDRLTKTKPAESTCSKDGHVLHGAGNGEVIRQND